MKRSHLLRGICFFLLMMSPVSQFSQTGKLPKTPLPQNILNMLSNELSGQIAYNNEVILAGAPWLRKQEEFSDTFHESRKIYDMVKNYGIDTVRLDRFPSDKKISYAFEAELWTVRPQKMLIARLDADAAMIAEGSSSVNMSSDLIYLPPLTAKEIKDWTKAGIQEKYDGKIALMWSHPKGEYAEALNAAGLAGVISFQAQDRYFDPDQVVYTRGSYEDKENLKFGLTISWRQWTELLEDLEKGRKIAVQCRIRMEESPYKFENVFCWIPGTEPDKKGVIFTAHLFEGYTKRGANDDMSGCVVQLEILRALTKLVAGGELPRPRRTIYFLWPDEIWGTYEHFRRHPGFIEKLSSNINMDMVGEGMRKHNAILDWTECPNHLPCYLDGLGDAFMNYIWRTNDIVYLPDSQFNARGQIFPLPLWEKNGSRDAFRYFTHVATGGSDHICFNNPVVSVPGIEMNVWPDQWYHADTDTVDKSDPTQLKRAAFLGAACVWVAANCTDETLVPLLDAVNAFGYSRVGKRELPKALNLLDTAKAENLSEKAIAASNLLRFAVAREAGAFASVKDICTDSDKAARLIQNRIQQWDFYGNGLEDQVWKYAALRASELAAPAPAKPEPTEEEKKCSFVFPSIHKDVKGKEFYLERTDRFIKFMKEQPDTLKKLKVNRTQQRSIQNFINGRRSITEIRNSVMADTMSDLPLKNLLGYLEFLKKIGWIEY
ncbi:MAG: M28 family peptidase [Candidatus Aminicenantes bacterium]|nr:M28 family peptidase [Candidatus Aminicenantes bacterium]